MQICLLASRHRRRRRRRARLINCARLPEGQMDCQTDRQTVAANVLCPIIIITITMIILLIIISCSSRPCPSRICRHRHRRRRRRSRHHRHQRRHRWVASHRSFGGNLENILLVGKFFAYALCQATFIGSLGLGHDLHSQSKKWQLCCCSCNSQCQLQLQLHSQLLLRATATASFGKQF